MKTKYWLYKTIIPLSLVASVYMVFLAMEAMEAHKQITAREPNQSSSLERGVELMRIRDSLLGEKSIADVNFDMLVKVALINEELDSLCRSERYGLDYASYERVCIRYEYLSFKLILWYRMLILGAVMLMALAIFLSSRFYFSNRWMS